MRSIAAPRTTAVIWGILYEPEGLISVGIQMAGTPNRLRTSLRNESRLGEHPRRAAKPAGQQRYDGLAGRRPPWQQQPLVSGRVG